MIEDIIRKFNSLQPGLKVTRIYDYDQSAYLIVAVHCKDDMSNPYYLMEKKGTRIMSYAMNSHLNEMPKLLKRMIYTRDKI